MAVSKLRLCVLRSVCPWFTKGHTSCLSFCLHQHALIMQCEVLNVIALQKEGFRIRVRVEVVGQHTRGVRLSAQTIRQKER